MQPALTDATTPSADDAAASPPASGTGTWRKRAQEFGPLIGLLALCVIGTVLNPDFATWDNAMNVLTRTAFIGIIAVGMSFVIISGGIDLSVGSMAALIAGSVILVMNWIAPFVGNPLFAVVIGMGTALVLGAAFGMAHGVLITKGRIEPFIVTLGTLGIFRAYLTYFADGGAITLDGELSDIYSPVYYGSWLSVPIPIWVFAIVALAGGVLLNRTRYGRYVQAIGSNEQVARYSAVAVDRIKILTYMLLGICVGIATVLYVPRLGSGSPHPRPCWGRGNTSPPGLGLAHHRPVVGTGSHCRRDRGRHRPSRRAGPHLRHGGRCRAALGDQQHPQPHQHHQRLPECRGAGVRHHRRGLPSAGTPMTHRRAAVPRQQAVPPRTFTHPRRHSYEKA
jgi:ribose transport system permease protein